MKKLILYCFLFYSLGLNAQFAPIPDANFRDFLRANYPATLTVTDQLIIAQAALVTGTLNCSGQNISDLEGLQHFTGINSLNASYNMLTQANPASSLSLLKTLNLSYNQLDSLPNLSGITNLQKIFASNNRLHKLPDLSANTLLTQLIVFNNRLDSLPDLQLLPYLSKLDAGNNRIKITPSFSANPSLKLLSLDRNELTTAPDFSANDSLTMVQLHGNRFTFQDMLPLAAYPGFDSVFTLHPQQYIPATRDTSVYTYSSYYLQTLTDRAVSGITYQWYRNGTLLLQNTNDSSAIVSVCPQHVGAYYARLSHAAVPGVYLQTDTFQLTVLYCPNAGDLQFEFEKGNCRVPGKMKITFDTLTVSGFSFYLSPVNGSNSLYSLTGNFEGLNQPEYRLQITAGGCTYTHTEAVRIPYEACKEEFITPDQDGQKDSYYFEKAGKVVVYDKSGKAVKTMTSPIVWDGTGEDGKLLNPGYYLAEINQGEDLVRITVLY